MEVFKYRDYKIYIRDRVRSLRRKSPAFTLARLAAKLGIQASYISRVLNDDRFHFSEDQLYRILLQLELRPAECEYLMLVRTFQTTALPERKKHLGRHLDQLEKARGTTEFHLMRRELSRIVSALETWSDESE